MRNIMAKVHRQVKKKKKADRIFPKQVIVGTGEGHRTSESVRFHGYGFMNDARAPANYFLQLCVAHYEQHRSKKEPGTPAL